MPWMPRSDVLAGGLTAALTVLVGMVLDRSLPFDFTAVQAAFAVAITYGIGWYIGKFKPLMIALVAPVASLLTAVVGQLLFDVPLDKALLSNLIATIAGAVLTARVPPFDASPLDPDAPANVQRRRT